MGLRTRLRRKPASLLTHTFRRFRTHGQVLPFPLAASPLPWPWEAERSIHFHRATSLNGRCKGRELLARLRSCDCFVYLGIGGDSTPQTWWNILGQSTCSFPLGNPNRGLEIGLEQMLGADASAWLRRYPLELLFDRLVREVRQ